MLEKLLRRLRQPSLLREDLRWRRDRAIASWIRRYAEYHRHRGTPGRVFRIPGHGYRMWLPINWGKTVVQRRFGIYELWTSRTLRAVVKPGMTVVELGACYGEFTIQLSKLVGSKGRILAFEPFPKYFEILERNVKLNRCSNVTLVNKAAGAVSVQEVRFDPGAIHPYASLSQISGLEYAAHDAKALMVESADTTAIPCVSLREFLKERQVRMDVLTLDIEGCELAVFQDLNKSLCDGTQRPIIYLELHEHFYRPGDLQWLREHFIQEWGYQIQTVHTGHWLCTPKAMERMA